MIQKLSPQVQPLILPVTEGSPAGTDHSAQPNFPAPERYYSLSLSARKEAEAHARELLQESKDLRLAVVICLAWTDNDGLDGYARGLQLVEAILEGYCCSAFPSLELPAPERKTQRTLALEWLCSSPLIKSLTTQPASRSGAGSGPPGPATENSPLGQLLRYAERPDTASPPQALAAGMADTLAACVDRLGRIAGLAASPAGGAKLDINPNGSAGWASRLSKAASAAMQPTQGSAATEARITQAQAPTQPNKIVEGSREKHLTTLQYLEEAFRQREPSSPIQHLLRVCRELARLDYLTTRNQFGKELDALLTAPHKHQEN